MTFRPSCADRVLAVREEPLASATCVTTPLEEKVVVPTVGHDDPPNEGFVGRCILLVAHISASALLDSIAIGCYSSGIHSDLSRGTAFSVCQTHHYIGVLSDITLEHVMDR